jgi:hypothetical protein
MTYSGTLGAARQGKPAAEDEGCEKSLDGANPAFETVQMQTMIIARN